MISMDAARTLRHARRRAGLTQRELGRLAEVAQPTIARIERAIEVPRVDTLARLLRNCGETLESAPTLGAGVDLTAIRELLRMTPAQRAATLVAEGRTHERVARARRTR